MIVKLIIMQYVYVIYCDIVVNKEREFFWVGCRFVGNMEYGIVLYICVFIYNNVVYIVVCCNYMLNVVVCFDVNVID